MILQSSITSTGKSFLFLVGQYYQLQIFARLRLDVFLAVSQAQPWHSWQPPRQQSPPRPRPEAPLQIQRPLPQFPQKPQLQATATAVTASPFVSPHCHGGPRLIATPMRRMPPSLATSQDTPRTQPRQTPRPIPTPQQIQAVTPLLAPVTPVQTQRGTVQPPFPPFIIAQHNLKTQIPCISLCLVNQLYKLLYNFIEFVDVFASCIQQSSTIQSSPRVSSLRWTKDATLSFDHCVLVQHDPVSKASRYSYLKSSTTFATSLHDSLVDHNRQHSNNISLFPLLVYRFLSHVRLMPTGPQASRSRTATKWTKCLSASAAVWKSA